MGFVTFFFFLTGVLTRFKQFGIIFEVGDGDIDVCMVRYETWLVGPWITKTETLGFVRVESCQTPWGNTLEETRTKTPLRSVSRTPCFVYKFLGSSVLSPLSPCCCFYLPYLPFIILPSGFMFVVITLIHVNEIYVVYFLSPTILPKIFIRLRRDICSLSEVYVTISVEFWFSYLSSILCVCDKFSFDNVIIVSSEVSFLLTVLISPCNE